MKKYELKYYFQTPAIFFIVFLLFFMQILRFTSQRESYEKEMILLEDRAQQSAAMLRNISASKITTIYEIPDEYYLRYVPKDMSLEDYKKLYQQHLTDSIDLYDQYAQYQGKPESPEKLFVETALLLNSWQLSTQLNLSFNSEKEDYLETPAEYFGEEKWRELKSEFRLSDYQGITVSELPPASTVQHDIWEKSVKTIALYKLDLYQKNHLPQTRFSSNGFIDNLLQRNILSTIVYLGIAFVICIFILSQIHRKNLNRLYYLTLGQKKLFFHRLSLMFSIIFVTIFSSELVILLLRNLTSGSVKLNYPIMAYDLNKTMQFDSVVNLTPLDINPLPLDLANAKDLINLNTYPLYGLLLISFVHVVLLIVLIVSVVYFFYEAFVAKNIIIIASGLGLLIIPTIIAGKVYSFYRLSALLEPLKMLNGKGPWSYVSLLIGLFVVCLLINLLHYLLHIRKESYE